MDSEILRNTSGLPYDPIGFRIPVSHDFKRKCKKLARRKHTRAYLIGFSTCGQFSIWQGMLHGNLWALSIRDIDRRLAL